MDVEEGEDVRLLCSATGKPVPLIEWKRQNMLLQSRNSTNELHITEIELKHGGNYTCTAKNAGGSSSYSVLVRVTRCK